MAATLVASPGRTRNPYHPPPMQLAPVLRHRTGAVAIRSSPPIAATLAVVAADPGPRLDGVRPSHIVGPGAAPAPKRRPRHAAGARSSTGRDSPQQAADDATGDVGELAPLSPQRLRRADRALPRLRRGAQRRALTARVRELNRALRADDRAAARAAWQRADSTFARIGAAYGALGSLGDAIDGAPGGLARGARRPALHRPAADRVGLWRGVAPARSCPTRRACSATSRGCAASSQRADRPADLRDARARDPRGRPARPAHAPTPSDSGVRATADGARGDARRAGHADADARRPRRRARPQSRYWLRPARRDARGDPPRATAAATRRSSAAVTHRARDARRPPRCDARGAGRRSPASSRPSLPPADSADPPDEPRPPRFLRARPRRRRRLAAALAGLRPRAADAPAGRERAALREQSRSTAPTRPGSSPRRASRRRSSRSTRSRPTAPTLLEALDALSSQARALTAGYAFGQRDRDDPPPDSGTLGTTVAARRADGDDRVRRVAVRRPLRAGGQAPGGPRRRCRASRRRHRPRAAPTATCSCTLDANQRDTVVHALRELLRPVRGALAVRWTLDGFLSARPRADAPQRSRRNLFGFRDGTVEPDRHRARRAAVAAGRRRLGGRRHVPGRARDPHARRVLGSRRPARAGEHDRALPRQRRAARRHVASSRTRATTTTPRATGSRSTPTSGSPTRARRDRTAAHPAPRLQLPPRRRRRPASSTTGLIFIAFNREHPATSSRRSRSASPASR